MTDDRRLSKTARDLLGSTAETRINAIQSIPFISYAAAKLIRARMEQIVIAPRSHRPASMLIAGSTNNGKTMLVRRFVESHPEFDDPDADASLASVLYVQMPPTPDPRQFYMAILDRLQSPVRRTAVLSQLQSQTIRLLGLVNTKVLVIDEIHNIHAGRIEHQRGFLNLLRYISNEHGIHLIACGLATSVRALQSDEQLANRFEHWPLPKWRVDGYTKALLNTIETLLPLRKQSSLSDPELIKRIVGLSEGTIGEIVRLILSAACEAIRSGQEFVDNILIDELRWIPPSERRAAAEHMLGVRT